MHSHEMTIALAKQHRAQLRAEADQYRRLAGTRTVRDARPRRRPSRAPLLRSLASSVLAAARSLTDRSRQDLPTPASATVGTNHRRG